MIINEKLEYKNGNIINNHLNEQINKIKKIINY